MAVDWHDQSLYQTFPFHQSTCQIYFPTDFTVSKTEFDFMTSLPKRSLISFPDVLKQFVYKSRKFWDKDMKLSYLLFYIRTEKFLFNL